MAGAAWPQASAPGGVGAVEVGLMGDGGENRSIRIEGSAVGSAIVSGDGNIVYVIHQTLEERREPDERDAIGPNPYMGLAAFGEQDADRYFGREVQVERLWHRLQALYEQSTHKEAVPRFLPILGPSGCGKSSLALAGLVPELARRPLPNTASSRVAVLRPGTHPLEALSGVLAKVVTDDPMPVTKAREFTQELSQAEVTRGYDGLRRVVALMPQIAASPLVLLVDQFEEVYSLCQDLTERQAFIDNLLIATADPTGNLSVVITLRSDFLGETQRHQALNQIIGSDQSVIVPVMTAAELGRAIAAPAKQVGHPLDEATVDRLVQDVDGREGALPLLQFALTQIWEGLREGRSPLETYREIGGVGGALAGKAEEIYTQLLKTEQAKAIAERVFTGLVQLGEGTRDTRRQVRIKDLVTREDSLEQVWEVIRKFSVREARLITLSTVDNVEIAEVTHEALFDHWQAVQCWIDSRRDDIRFQRRLEAAASYWDEQGRPAGLLWRSPDLDSLRNFAQRSELSMSRLSHNFFTASHRAVREEQRRQKIFIFALASALIFAGNRWQQSEQRRMKLYEATAIQLAEVDPLNSLIYGLAAIKLNQSLFINPLKTRNSDPTENMLLEKPNRIMRASKVLGHVSPVSTIDLSPDRKTIISGDENGTIRLWDREGNIRGELNLKEAVLSARFSLDNSFLMSSHQDGSVRMWDRQGKGKTYSINASSVGFSPDGQTIISGHEDGTINLWDRRGELIKQPSHIEQPSHGNSQGVYSVKFSLDGKTIISQDGDAVIKLWDRQGNLISEFFANIPYLTNLRFERSIGLSPDGLTIVSGDRNGIVSLIDRKGNLVNEWEGHQSPISFVGFSPDGQTLSTGDNDGLIKLWNLQGKLVSEPFKDHLQRISSVIFSADKEFIVSSDHGGTINLWSPQANPIRQPVAGSLNDSWNSAQTVALSQEEKAIVIGSKSGTISLWDYQGNPIGEPFQAHEYRPGRDSDGVFSLAISPDGQTIVSSGIDGLVQLWSRQGNFFSGSRIEDHSGIINSLSFSPDGKTIIGGGKDGAIRLWDSQGNAVGNPFSAHPEQVLAVDFSSDGQTIVSGGIDGTIRLWNLQGKPIGQPFDGHSEGVLTVSFSSDGQTIVSGGIDGTIRLWNRQGEPIGQPFQKHLDSVFAVNFSLDGETILSASTDGIMRLWNYQGKSVGEPIRLTGTDPSDSFYKIPVFADFSPDGQTIISVSEDGTIGLWPIHGSWLAYTCDRLRGYLQVLSRVDKLANEARYACKKYD